jgi:hypothetical protein
MHLAVELNAIDLLDTDGDGIDDTIDIDDDNDGILDTDESSGNDPNGDHDGDYIPNYLDNNNNGLSGDGSNTSYTDSNGDGIPDAYDNDNDGVADHLDLDSDNDGIPDNIEGQKTTSYIAPTGIVGINGLDNAYENEDTFVASSYTIENTDGDSNPDYLDTDSDGDTVPDTTEANLTLSGSVGKNGLYSVLENSDNYSDVNGVFDNTQTDNFPDADGDVDTTGDVDWRDLDQTGTIDTDLDGVPNSTDIDDDNDGILDTVEQDCTQGSDITPSVVNTVGTIGNVGQSIDQTIANDNGAALNSNGETVVFDFGVELPIDTQVTISLWRNSNANSREITINQSTSATAGQDLSNPVTIQRNDIPDNSVLSYIYTITSTTARYIDIEMTQRSGGRIEIVEIVSEGVLSCNDSLDTDNDGIPNYLDLDSDSDGIPDNIEGQPTLDYVAPTGSVGANGLYNVYENNNDTTSATSFSLENTDSSNDSIPDYLDTDSDNDGAPDRIEADLSLSGNVGLNGLDNNYDTNDNYADVNGSFDDTQKDNFPDSDNDVESGGNIDWRDADAVFRDNDNDSVVDATDLDDDNDGILDSTEYGTYDFEDDEDNDGIPNYLDTSDDGAGDGSTTDYSDSNSDGIPDVYDFDLDGVPNHFDLDSDNDGIPDNIEAQTTTGYIAPTNTYSNTGIDLAYGSGISPQNTDNSGEADYLDLDADDDGILDNTEAGIVRSGNVGNNGLDDNYDSVDDYSDVNGSFDNSQTDNFDDEDSDVNSGGDVDYRDDTFTYDRDNDNVNDEIDLDDDNDGIVDLTEYGDNPCSTNSTSFSWDNNYVEGGTAATNGEDPVEIAPSKTIDNVGIVLSRTSNVSSESNFRVNDFVTSNSSYSLAIKARSNATSTHTFSFDTPIKNLAFTLYDVDQDSGTATDQVQIVLTAEDGTNYTLQSGDYTTGSSNTYSGSNIFTGTVQGGNQNVVINAISSWIIKLRIVYSNSGTGSISGDQRIAIGDLSFCTPIDTDGDNVFDFRDLDADNDGIPDNIEAQTTKDYIAPTGNYNAFGIDLAYSTGISPVNTDEANDNPDYLDLDSDDDGTDDIDESGSGLTDANSDGRTDGAVGTNGLDNTLDNGDTYADVNGSFDNTVTDNFTDTDGDVNNNGGDLDYRDDVTGTDTDGDGINDDVDIDDDNDGILDTDEDGSYDAQGDEDNDGTLNYKDTVDNGNGGPGGTTSYTDSNSDGIPDVFDNDLDGIANHLDIDADNDGIPDNIEAQSTNSYVAPSGNVGANGLDNAYENNVTPSATSNLPLTNTDSSNDAIPDYLDLDSDHDGTPDIQENGDSDNVASGTDSDNDGLDDNFEGSNVNDGYDVNDEINTPSTDLPDEDSDVATQDVDYRDDIDDGVTPVTAGKILWVRSDKDVSSSGNIITGWIDQTGTVTNTINGNPLINQFVNFNPVAAFDGTGDYIQTNLQTYAGIYPDLTVFAVYTPSASQSNAVWGEDDNQNDDRYLRDQSTGTTGEIGDGDGGETSFTNSFNVGSSVIATISYDEDQANGSYSYLNGLR